MNEKGINKDSGKLRVDLVAPEIIEAFARVSGQAAGEKYPERNWEKGMEWMRQYASAMRHLLKWAKGEDLDPETGLPHIEHALWRIGALVTYRDRGIGTDDRPYTKSKLENAIKRYVDRLKEARFVGSFDDLQDEGRGQPYDYGTLPADRPIGD